jgi:hypothetical protein
LFHIEVIDDGSWRVAAAATLRHALRLARLLVVCAVARLNSGASEGGSEVRAYRREREELVLGSWEQAVSSGS